MSFNKKNNVELAKQVREATHDFSEMLKGCFEDVINSLDLGDNSEHNNQSNQNIL